MDLSEYRTTPHGIPVLVVRGEVDMSSAPRLRSHLDALIGGGEQKIVVDLGAVSFFDSTGLRVLDDALREAQARDATVALAGVQSRVARLFAITGMSAQFELFDTAEHAAANCSEKA